MRRNRLVFLFSALLVLSCSTGVPEPVEIYQEDACASCRMAVSDKKFAGEIITTEHEVLKFDDIGCLERFREKRLEDPVAAVFYVDYDTDEWLNEADAKVVRTGLTTPMGSGLVAFRDAERAATCVTEHPPEIRQ